MWFDDVIPDDTDDELDMIICKTIKRDGTYITICNCKYGIYSH